MIHDYYFTLHTHMIDSDYLSQLYLHTTTTMTGGMTAQCRAAVCGRGRLSYMSMIAKNKKKSKAKRMEPSLVSQPAVPEARRGVAAGQ